jgi:hypothetical protein
MKKAEAEQVIRHLCHVWAAETGQPMTAESMPSFSAFKAWLDQKHYSHYLDFRSRCGADYDAEHWFDQEFKQTWRN